MKNFHKPLPAALLSIIIIFTASAFASTPEIWSDEDEIAVKFSTPTPDGTRAVRLRPVTPSIIRVTASADTFFAPDASLAVIRQKGGAPFSLYRSDSTVTMLTSQLSATVNFSDGSIYFRDKEGKLIAAEEPGGRNFSPINVEGTDGWSVAQRFQSLDSLEGLYGLGQHQSDQFNYKRLDEELFQYNTKVSVPFILSTNKYGILWDSYSLCRFGNPEPYRQLGELFTLTDTDGIPGALTGRYIPGKAGRDTIVRREPAIYFEHLLRNDLSHVINLPKDFDFNGSYVTYEGTLTAPETGLYRFILYYSGYMRVYINGMEEVKERWRTAWNPNAFKFSVYLEKGHPTPLKIEWTPNGSVAYCGLRAYPPEEPSRRNEMRWWGEMQDAVDYYFIHGSDMDGVISGYRTLTGKAPIMPKWVLGYWQSREKYNTASELLATLSEFRSRKIPIDNIVLDWLHWKEDSWGSHEFDPKRFPDPKGMVDSVHSMHGRFMVSVWPKFYVTTDHYKEFDKNGWMYQLPVTDSIRDWVGPGYLGSFYDAYSPEARRLFWHQIEDHYLPLGVDAWWMDASEPNIRDCTDLQYRKDLITPTALGPSTKYFNAYGLMNAEAIYDGQRSSAPGKRVFLLTRSGFAGQQRYSTATWSGDIATRWEDMKAQISAGLNFAASGIPWWSMDIGGFCVEDRYAGAAKNFDRTGEVTPDLEEWRELNTRWYQFGAFVPIFRAHGQKPYREIFNIAPEEHPAYESILYYTRLRYDLMPYLYSLAAATHFDDYTLMRPLPMDFPADISLRSIGDQYMFGPSFLVAPVYTYKATTRSVRLPAGNLWYDFYTGNPIEGGETIEADAPYGRIPLFVRAGSIIPFGPEMQWSDEKPADPIDIYIYTGADGNFTIYEDENLNYNYEKGLYATIPLNWDDKDSTLTIGPRKGSFPGMLENRRFNIIKISPDDPKGFSRSNSAVSVDYSGESVRLTL